MAEERTTEEERNHIMEARRRAAIKKRKVKVTNNKSKSTETDEEDEDPDEGVYKIRGKSRRNFSGPVSQNFAFEP